VKFCDSAKVNIDVPQRIVDVIQQRRRILFGHRQIWQSAGQPPKTLESMLTVNPLMSFSILVKTLARSPELSLVIPIALVAETAATILSIFDTVTGSKRHVLWKRFGNKS
jgi:cellulose synthase/poly-beta-1,6-N-acetylglucosamine synthase-like glycosyltransferase